MKGNRIGLLAVLLMLLHAPGVVLADSAQVLPKGVSNVSVTYYNYFDIDQRYDPDGDAEDMAANYNADLDSSVFPDLAGFEASQGGPMPDGTATLGRSVVDFTLVYRFTDIVYNYGLTDRLTVGVLIPYNSAKNRVSARLDATAATVGKNTNYTLAGFNISDPTTYPLVPLLLPGSAPLTTQDIQDLLGPGLDVDGDGSVLGPEPTGYGYDPVNSWSDSDIGDIELLAKYRFRDEAPFRLAVSGGLRLPTGREDDPDSLVDVAFGDGQTDVLLRFHADYLGVEKLLLNGTLRYDIQLPAERTMRVPADVNLPLTDQKDKVDLDLGDILELEFAGTYTLSRTWYGGLKYRYTQKAKDSVDGYPGLEDETDTTSHMAFVSLGYTTVRSYLDKEAKVPLEVGVTYRNRFAGTNNVTRSEYVSLDLSLYF